MNRLSSPVPAKSPTTSVIGDRDAQRNSVCCLFDETTRVKHQQSRLAILVVTAMYPHPGNEGSGAFVMQQVEQLRALGHSVDVLHFASARSKFRYPLAALEVRRRTQR